MDAGKSAAHFLESNEFKGVLGIPMHNIKQYQDEYTVYLLCLVGY